MKVRPPDIPHLSPLHPSENSGFYSALAGVTGHLPSAMQIPLQDVISDISAKRQLLDYQQLQHNPAVSSDVLSLLSVLIESIPWRHEVVIMAVGSAPLKWRTDRSVTFSLAHPVLDFVCCLYNSVVLYYDLARAQTDAALMACYLLQAAMLIDVVIGKASQYLTFLKAFPINRDAFEMLSLYSRTLALDLLATTPTASTDPMMIALYKGQASKFYKSIATNSAAQRGLLCFNSGIIDVSALRSDLLYVELAVDHCTPDRTKNFIEENYTWAIFCCKTLATNELVRSDPQLDRMVAEASRRIATFLITPSSCGEHRFSNLTLNPEQIEALHSLATLQDIFIGIKPIQSEVCSLAASEIFDEKARPGVSPDDVRTIYERLVPFLMIDNSNTRYALYQGISDMHNICEQYCTTPTVPMPLSSSFFNRPFAEQVIDRYENVIEQKDIELERLREMCMNLPHQEEIDEIRALVRGKKAVRAEDPLPLQLSTLLHEKDREIQRLKHNIMALSPRLQSPASSMSEASGIAPSKGITADSTELTSLRADLDLIRREVDKYAPWTRGPLHFRVAAAQKAQAETIADKDRELTNLRSALVKSEDPAEGNRLRALAQQLGARDQELAALRRELAVERAANEAESALRGSINRVRTPQETGDEELEQLRIAEIEMAADNARLSDKVEQLQTENKNLRDALSAIESGHQGDLVEVFARLNAQIKDNEALARRLRETSTATADIAADLDEDLHDLPEFENPDVSAERANELARLRQERNAIRQLLDKQAPNAQNPNALPARVAALAAAQKAQAETIADKDRELTNLRSALVKSEDPAEGNRLRALAQQLGARDQELAALRRELAVERAANEAESALRGSINRVRTPQETGDEELEQLRIAEIEMAADNARLSDKVEQLQTENKNLRDALSAIESGHQGDLVEVFARLNAQIKDNEALARRLRETSTATADIAADLDEDLHDLPEFENPDVSAERANELARLRQERNAIRQLLDKQAPNAQNPNALPARVAALAAAQKAQAETIADKDRELTNLRSALVKSEDPAEGNRLRALAQQLGARDQELAALRRELAVERAANEAESALRGSINRVRTPQETGDEELEQLRIAEIEMAADNARLSDKVEQLQTENKNLRDALSAIESGHQGDLVEVFARLNAQIKDNEALARRLRETSTATADIAADLDEDLHDLPEFENPDVSAERANELARLRQERNAIRQLLDKQAPNAQNPNALPARVAALAAAQKAQAETIADKDRELTNLRSALVKSEDPAEGNRLRALAQQLGARDQELAALRRELAVERAANEAESALRGSINRVRTPQETGDEELEQLRIAEIEMAADNARLSDKVEQLQTENKNLRDALSAIESGHQGDLVEVFARLNAQIKDNEALARRLRETSTATADIAADLDEDLHDLPEFENPDVSAERANELARLRQERNAIRQLLDKQAPNAQNPNALPARVAALAAAQKAQAETIADKDRELTNLRSALVKSEDPAEGNRLRALAQQLGARDQELAALRRELAVERAANEAESALRGSINRVRTPQETGDEELEQLRIAEIEMAADNARLSDKVEQLQTENKNLRDALSAIESGHQGDLVEVFARLNAQIKDNEALARRLRETSTATADIAADLDEDLHDLPEFENPDVSAERANELARLRQERNAIRQLLDKQAPNAQNPNALPARVAALAAAQKAQAETIADKDRELTNLRSALVKSEDPAEGNRLRALAQQLGARDQELAALRRELAVERAANEAESALRGSINRVRTPQETGDEELEQLRIAEIEMAADNARLSDKVEQLQTENKNLRDALSAIESGHQGDLVEVFARLNAQIKDNEALARRLRETSTATADIAADLDEDLHDLPEFENPDVSAERANELARLRQERNAIRQLLDKQAPNAQNPNALPARVAALAAAQKAQAETIADKDRELTNLRSALVKSEDPAEGNRLRALAQQLGARDQELAALRRELAVERAANEAESALRGSINRVRTPQETGDEELEQLRIAEIEMAADNARLSDKVEQLQTENKNLRDALSAIESGHQGDLVEVFARLNAQIKDNEALARRLRETSTATADIAADLDEDLHDLPEFENPDVSAERANELARLRQERNAIRQLLDKQAPNAQNPNALPARVAALAAAQKAQAETIADKDRELTNLRSALVKSEDPAEGNRLRALAQQLGARDQELAALRRELAVERAANEAESALRGSINRVRTPQETGDEELEQLRIAEIEMAADNARLSDKVEQLQTENKNLRDALSAIESGHQGDLVEVFARLNAQIKDNEALARRLRETSTATADIAADLDEDLHDLPEFENPDVSAERANELARLRQERNAIRQLLDKQAPNAQNPNALPARVAALAAAQKAQAETIADKDRELTNLRSALVKSEDPAEGNRLRALAQQLGARDQELAALRRELAVERAANEAESALRGSINRVRTPQETGDEELEQLRIAEIEMAADNARLSDKVEQLQTENKNLRDALSAIESGHQGDLVEVFARLNAQIKDNEALARRLRETSTATADIAADLDEDLHDLPEFENPDVSAERANELARLRQERNAIRQLLDKQAPNAQNPNALPARVAALAAAQKAQAETIADKDRELTNLRSALVKSEDPAEGNRLRALAQQLGARDQELAALRRELAVERAANEAESALRGSINRVRTPQETGDEELEQLRIAEIEMAADNARLSDKVEQLQTENKNLRDALSAIESGHQGDLVEVFARLNAQIKDNEALARRLRETSTATADIAADLDEDLHDLPEFENPDVSAERANELARLRQERNAIRQLLDKQAPNAQNPNALPARVAALAAAQKAQAETIADKDRELTNLRSALVKSEDPAEGNRLRALAQQLGARDQELAALRRELAVERAANEAESALRGSINRVRTPQETGDEELEQLRIAEIEMAADNARLSDKVEQLQTENKNLRDALSAIESGHQGDLVEVFARLNAQIKDNEALARRLRETSTATADIAADLDEDLHDLPEFENPDVSAERANELARLRQERNAIRQLLDKQAPNAQNPNALPARVAALAAAQKAQAETIADKDRELTNLRSALVKSEDPAEGNRLRALAQQLGARDQELAALRRELAVERAANEAESALRGSINRVRTPQESGDRSLRASDSDLEAENMRLRDELARVLGDPSIRKSPIIFPTYEDATERIRALEFCLSSLTDRRNAGALPVPPHAVQLMPHELARHPTDSVIHQSAGSSQPASNLEGVAEHLHNILVHVTDADANYLSARTRDKINRLYDGSMSGNGLETGHGLDRLQSLLLVPDDSPETIKMMADIAACALEDQVTQIKILEELVAERGDEASDIDALITPDSAEASNIRILRTELDRRVRQVSRLEKQVMELHNQLDQALQQDEDAFRTLDSTPSDLAELRKKIQKYKDGYIRKAEQFRELEQEHSKLLVKVAQLTEQIEETHLTDVENIGSTGNRTFSTHAFQPLTVQLDDGTVTLTNDTYEGLLRKIQKYKNAYLYKSRAWNSQKETLKGRDSEIAHLRADLFSSDASSRSSSCSSNADVAEMRRAIRQLERKLTDSEATNRRFQEEIRTYKKLLDANSRVISDLKSSVASATDGQDAVTAGDWYGNTRLMEAVVTRNQALLNRSIGFAGATNLDGYTALMLAARENNTDAIPPLLEKEKGFRRPNGQTALCIALEYGHYNAAQMLAVECPAYSAPLRPGQQARKTELMTAAEHGDICGVWALLEAQAGLQDRDGRTALMYAAERGHVGIARLLVEREADRQATTGATALMAAAKAGVIEIVRMLLPREARKQGAYEPFMNKGHTALMLAVYYGRLDCAEALLEYERGIQDATGKSALYYAAYPSSRVDAATKQRLKSLLAAVN
ncbi:Ankyrin repeat protein 3 [Giardia muris]|uniref:Ankyrin repeat protein 3 n=1 Tax=Giardia muris TaxID=5742 RepID=A0A4Z1SRY0_GIAMU|nr:Ankyrin repeat protein 3 [Giardia muris]|eukprot:TNJ27745.1 Ankyrin repeat protein 3 [Giardia muris]